ncbi:MAG TPA: hypothetical protein VEW48_18775 [Thermoanaerobaculia bacterium]|nr:hypothetical protein [Thermoanaerobaculia bacterium]
MSFRVLVIPEDFRKDEPLLKPILEKMLEACGRTAKVRICKDPLLGGVREALKWSRIQEILDRYRGMVDCFLLVVDRDGLAGRKKSLAVIEKEAARFLGAEGRFFAENAWQEVEVWALAGLTDLPRSWAWKTVRAEPNAKEAYFELYVRQKGLPAEPFGGRLRLGLEASKNYPRIRRLCPEDVGVLESRLRGGEEAG